jgi:hypothetical protein
VHATICHRALTPTLFFRGKKPLCRKVPKAMCFAALEDKAWPKFVMYSLKKNIILVQTIAFIFFTFLAECFPLCTYCLEDAYRTGY